MVIGLILLISVAIERLWERRLSIMTLTLWAFAVGIATALWFSK